MNTERELEALRATVAMLANDVKALRVERNNERKRGNVYKMQLDRAEKEINLHAQAREQYRQRWHTVSEERDRLAEELKRARNQAEVRFRDQRKALEVGAERAGTLAEELQRLCQRADTLEAIAYRMGAHDDEVFKGIGR